MEADLIGIELGDKKQLPLHQISEIHKAEPF